jgi:peptidoglycan/xylan/chitin deacetylase (PgdA/CDA1 family)
MNNLMVGKDFDVNLAKQNLWMSEQDLVITESKGHIIGLHSYSHPTQMSKLSETKQSSEYQRNYEHLSKLIGKPINVMSHPCGDYNETTLNILKEMNIDIGFRSSMSVKKIRSSLEIPREDHANVFREMHQ